MVNNPNLDLETNALHFPCETLVLGPKGGLRRLVEAKLRVCAIRDF